MNNCIQQESISKSEHKYLANDTSKKLRIAFVLRQFPLLSETFILNQIIGLTKSGHAIDIFTFEKIELKGVDHRKFINHKLFDKQIYMFTFPQGRIKRILRVAFIFISNIFKNWKIIFKCLDHKKYGQSEAINNLFKLEPFLKKNYDIVHCQFGPQANELIFLKDLIDIKFVTSFRGYDVSSYIKNNSEDVYNELFIKGDKFLPVCDYFTDRIINLGCDQKKVNVLYSGIDPSEFMYNLPKLDKSKNIRIISIGRLVEKKGLEYAILAIKKLQKEYNNIIYKIIGDGKERKKLQELTESFGLKSIITFTNNIPDDEVRKCLHESDVFLLPCITAENGDQEGIPNVIKEAMACGVPVVSTFHSGITELVENNVTGCLVPEKDVDSIVEKIKFLTNNPETYIKISKNARNVIENHFNIDELNKKLEYIYCEITKNKT